MGTLVCTIELDKNGGVTVTIDNADAKIKQTVTMNGTTIELKVAGDSATSTVTQSQEKVSISCRQFEVKAEETVSISSGKASTYRSDDTMTLQSARDMTQKSDANVGVSGQKIAVTGQTEVALTGGSQSKVTLGAAGASMAAIKVSLEGQAQLAGKAPQVEIKSDAMMVIESSGVATLKGSLTNVQGNLVNLGEAVSASFDRLTALFLEELSALDSFAAQREAEGRLLPSREDPDVRRILEALAFFSARTRETARAETRAAVRRIAGGTLDDVIVPCPASILVEASGDERLVEPARVPAGTQLRVTAPDGRVGIFTTTQPCTVLPAVIEGARIVERGRRVFLRVSLRALRPFRATPISLHVRRLNDYRASLALHDALAQHVVGAFAEIDGHPAEVPCRVTFGPEPPRRMEDETGSPGPLARTRAFFHHPDRELFLHAVVAEPWSTALSLYLELDPAFPTEIAISDDAFRLSVVPAENVWADFAEPLLCDGTRDAYPLRHPSPLLAGVELFGLRGVFRAGALIAPILPTALSQEGDAHELDDGDGAAPMLRLRLAGAFDEPVKVLIDARWSQPSLWSAAPGRLAITLQTKHLPGVSLRPLGPMRRPEESPLAREPSRVLDLLSLRMRPYLGPRDLAGVLEILGTTADGPYRGAHAWIDELDSEDAVDPAKVAAGIKRTYRLALRQKSAEDGPLVGRLAAHVAALLDAWTDDAVDVHVTTLREARLYRSQGAVLP